MNNTEVPKKTYTTKLYIVGDSYVGKSSLLRRYVNNDFTSLYTQTIGIEFQKKIVNIEENQVFLQLWEASGNKNFTNITNNYYKTMNGIIIMYDVTNQNSFDNIRKWLDYINDNAKEKVNILLIGNKTDMVDTVVKYHQGAKLARDLSTKDKPIHFMETSIKDNTNVDTAIDYLLRLCISAE